VNVQVQAQVRAQARAGDEGSSCVAAGSKGTREVAVQCGPRSLEIDPDSNERKVPLGGRGDAGDSLQIRASSRARPHQTVVPTRRYDAAQALRKEHPPPYWHERVADVGGKHGGFETRLGDVFPRVEWFARRVAPSQRQIEYETPLGGALPGLVCPIGGDIAGSSKHDMSAKRPGSRRDEDSRRATRECDRSKTRAAQLTALECHIIRADPRQGLGAPCRDHRTTDAQFAEISTAHRHRSHAAAERPS